MIVSVGYGLGKILVDVFYNTRKNTHTKNVGADLVSAPTFLTNNFIGAIGKLFYLVSCIMNLTG